MNNILKIENEGGVGKYLGLPEHFGRKKKDLFTTIIDRINQKASSWSSKLLSGAGKLVMLKSLLSAIPSYALTCFKLPQSLCKRIQSALTRFWWDSAPDKRKISWVAWDKMAKPKNKDGLGFKDINNYNDALLSKLSWHLLKVPNCLLARILVGKYCDNESVLNCAVPTSASHGWKSVMIGRDLLVKQLRWAVGNGTNINFWNDAWLSTIEKLQPFGPPPETLQNLKVSDLINPQTANCDIGKIDLILPGHRELILRIKPSLLGKNEQRIWLKHPSSEYLAKTGYFLAAETKESEQIPIVNPLVNWNEQVWNLKTSPKVKLFLWKALREALPVGNNLQVRITTSDPKCCRCEGPETTLHLLFLCPFAQAVWRVAPFTDTFKASQVTGTASGMRELQNLFTFPPTGLDRGVLFPWICWALWTSRNQKIFSNRNLTIEDTILRATQDAWEWIFAQDPPMKPSVRLTSACLQSSDLGRERTIVCCSDADGELT